MPDSQLMEFEPIGGLDNQTAATKLTDAQLSACRNWLCEDGEIRTRGGLQNFTPTGQSSSLRWAQHLETQVQGTLILGNDGLLKLLTTDFSAVAAAFTGPGTTFNALPAQPTVTIVNGALLIGNNNTGLLRIAYGAGVYTKITTVAPRYVAGHFARAIGLYDDLIAAPSGPIKFMWSVPGDETTWTGATNGSGSSIISDAGGDIGTGLKVLHNIPVIFREHGFHLAYSTGIAQPAYRLETWSREPGNTGCEFPNTLDTLDNVAYFVGQDNVYAFDLNQVTPIGTPIRGGLFNAIAAGFNVSGFCSVHAGGTSQRPRRRYNLFWDSQHLIYDIDDKKWTAHGYDFFTPAWLFESHVDSPFVDSGIMVISPANPAVFGLWNDTVNCESSSMFRSKKFSIGQLDKEYTIRRVLAEMRDFGTANPITGTLAAEQGSSGTVTSAATPSAPLANTGDGVYRRIWLDAQIEGNLVSLTISTPAGVKATIGRLGLLIGSEEMFRG